MLKIGDFSKLSRISIRMLRHYDEMGLLIPDNIDQFTNYRYYNESQLPIAGRINELKDMGFSLAVISEILKDYEDPQTLVRFLSVKQTELQDQAEEVAARLRLLETALERFRKDGMNMNYNVSLKEIPERYVASVRQVIPAYDKEAVLWEILNNETKEMQLQTDEPCYGLAVFHDKGYKESDVDVEIQISVKGTYKNTEHVVFKTIKSIQIASATYRGSYDQLTEANTSVANWVRDNGYEFAGNNFCIYHVSPAEAKSVDELVTEVCYPVKKK